MRDGPTTDHDVARLFTNPGSEPQRRYEALRSLLVDNLSLQQSAAKFGYSPKALSTLLSRLRRGHVPFHFSAPRPGPKSAPRSERAWPRILGLRQQGASVEEIASVLGSEGNPLSWAQISKLLRQHGFARLPKRPRSEQGLPSLQGAPRAQLLSPWPAGGNLEAPQAGVFLFLPLLFDLGLTTLVEAARYPRTSAIPAPQAVLARLLLKLISSERISYAGDVADDLSLGIFCGLSALPKTTKLTSYPYQITRSHNQRFLVQLAKSLRRLQPAAFQQADFNLDFHVIQAYGQVAQLEKHYKPQRSQSVRSVLTLFAHGDGLDYLAYANADLLRSERATSVLEFCDFWQSVSGELPLRLVFDSSFTTHAMLAQLQERKVLFITLRDRSKKVLSQLPPASSPQWQAVHLERPGKHKQPLVYQSWVTISSYPGQLRQLAVTDLGHEKPTLILSNDQLTPANQLIERYARRMLIENSICEQVNFLHLNALRSGVPVNVDLDLTLTLLAYTLYRLLAAQLRGHEHAQATKIYRRFIDTPGRLIFTEQGLTVRLRPPSHTPVLLQSQLANRTVEVPWLGGKQLRFEFQR